MKGRRNGFVRVGFILSATETVRLQGKCYRTVDIAALISAR